MTNMINKTRASRLRLRLFSFVLALVMMVVSSPVITALDSYCAVCALAEQSFVLTPEEGVTVTLSGMMPKGGHAEADAAQIEGEDVLHAYDITIYRADGSTFEPDEDAPITVSFRSGLIAEALEDDGATLEVAHISDNGKEESVELIFAEDDTASFEAESFSVYVIRTHTGDPVNHNPRRIYHFLSPDFTYHENEQGVTDHYCAPAYYFPNKLNDMVCVQAIRTGKSLQEIVLPQNDNSGLFYGWYKVECTGETEEITTIENGESVTRTNYIYRWGTGDAEHVPFNEPIDFPDATEDEDIYLAPLFGRYRFLTFHQDSQDSQYRNIIMSRKLIVLNDERKCTLTISDVRAPSMDPNKIIFWGWKYTHTAGDDLEGQTEIKQTVTTEGEEIPQTITIQDRYIINGIQPTDEEMRHMIYDIWPVFKEARWVEFEVGGNGATYRSPQFIILEDHTTGFNNVPTRPGYVFSGWYYGTEDNMITDSSANILTGVTKELTTGVSIENGELKITSDAEGSSANRVFRAKWTPVNEADFHVIVWKQNVTDDKNAGTAGYPDKTYDFAGYFPLEGETLRGATGVDPRTTTAYKNYEGNNKGFENFDETRTSQTDDNNFIGFHYSYSTVSDDGMNHPTYEGKINPDGSTVVNVYYDRDLMTVTFHYKASQVPSNMTVQDGYAYYETDDDFDELYGLVDGTYVPLTISTSIRQGSYVFSNRYTPSDAQDEDMFGVSDAPAEYILLNRVTNYAWTKTGVYNYVARDQANRNSTYYGLHDGAFSNDVTYNSRRNRWQYPSGFLNLSSTAYNGNLYTDGIASGSYTGTIYYISNSTLTETTDYTMNVQYYGMDADNNVFVLNKSTYYTYTLKGQPYEGQRYTREIDSEGYSGTRYVKQDGVFVAVDPSDHSADRSYGIRNGVYELLTKHEDSLVYEYMTPDGSSYSTPRYRRYRISSNSTFRYEEIWTGLYDQAYTFYGYKFPAEYRWNEASDGNGSTQTMLTGFTTADKPDYHLYAVADAGSAQIVHLLQKMDNTYGTEDENRVVAYTTAGTKQFQFTNKFEGFTVCGYSTTLIASGSGTGFNAVSPNETRDNITLSNNTTFYIYHKRQVNTFVFNDNYSGSVRTIHNIKYQRKLSDLNSPLYDPPAREHYTFAGWYEDSTCTQPFDFNTTMPAASKMVYAKWTKQRYRITVDPAGGEFPLGSGYSTFFNIDYDELVGEYADTRRYYVEAHNGDYVYANFQYDTVNAFPGVAAQPKGLAGVYRKAFYIPKNEIDAAYTRTFTVDGVEYSYADSGMTLEEFKSCIDMNTLYNRIDGTITYELESWHKVRADGTVEQIPFNFKNEVTEDITLRARWVQHGGYSLVYNPTMISTGVTGTMQRYYDPLDTSRKYVDKAPVIILAEPSNLMTTGAGGHEEDADDYTFRGWRIVDEITGEPEEPGVFYDPGETMILDAKYADDDGVIHMEAYYEKRAATVRRPDVVALTLDANSDTASVNAQELAGGRTEYADILNKQVKIARQINNCLVDLEKYIKNFSNTDGSLLIGWNTTRGPGNYIPEFYADAKVGVNKQGAASAPNNINTLYAVWEPMVYLTLNNTTSQPITFDLNFDEISGTVYSGYVNSVTGVLERTPFSELTCVTENSTGRFTVTLSAGTQIKLVIPEGVQDPEAPGRYTVSGTYARDNAKNLHIYNSGSEHGVSIVKSGATWRLNSTTTDADPIPYTTTGTLVKGAMGRLVRFTEENASVTLNLTARYYNTDASAWQDVDAASGVDQTVGFLVSSGTQSEVISVNASTTSVKLINDSYETNTFGMEVTSFNSVDYKFIGWYMTPSAAPNAYSVDGHAGDFGAARVEPTLALPPEETTYYALFVPYIKGDLTLSHSQRADSAGNAADDNGIGIRVQYYTQQDKSDIYYYGNAHTGSTGAAEVVLHNDIIDEKNTIGHLRVSVRAKPDDASTYKATYRNQVPVPSRPWEEGDFGSEDDGFLYAEFDGPVSERFVDSDTVKGLKELRTVNYYSVFSRAFDISYIYTARDGQQKEYKLTGNVDSYEDFELYVIAHTPYVRTLAGDTVWDTDNMVMNVDGTGMHAVLREVAGVRDYRTVTIIEKGGYTPTLLVPYGENLTAEQAEEHLAPATNDADQAFSYWDIVNTDTKEHVANCYDQKFTFKVWNNYTITPHYAETPATVRDEGQLITIDYIDTSRNLWGDAAYNNADGTTDRAAVTDKVVADLDIAFINNGDRILDAVDEGGNNRYQLGVMFEICGTTDDGTFDPAAYTEGESGRESRVRKLIANTSAKPSSTAKIDGVNCYYTKINISRDTVSTFNRSEFARSFTTANVKNCVFRMYAYMVTPNGELILSAPHYITLYQYASKEYAAPQYKRAKVSEGE